MLQVVSSLTYLQYIKIVKGLQVVNYRFVLNMSKLKDLLESSSIHGMFHVSQTKKLQRMFWIFVVVTGFSAAFILIHTSFQSWAESPIKTTVETLPISELTFPKITVCPPRNTYTSLNYDLVMTDEMNIDIEFRKELIDQYLMLNHEAIYKENLGGPGAKPPGEFLFEILGSKIDFLV